MITEKTLHIALGATLCAYTITVASYAYELCYLTTSWGGAIPFGVLSLAPLVGYFLGRLGDS